MLHIQMNQGQLENLATDLMMQMETTMVYRDNEIVGQIGKWGKETFALFWEIQSGTDVLYKIISESHVFTAA